MEFVPLEIEGELSADIGMIFHLNHYNPDHPIERLIPDGAASLVIELDDQNRYIYDNDGMTEKQLCKGSWVSGNFTEYLSFGPVKNTNLMGIRFKPGGLYPFIDVPMNFLKNVVLSGKEVFGDVIVDLRNRLKKENNSMHKNQMVYDWLHTLKLKLNKPINHKIELAKDKIMSSPTIEEINQIAQITGYSNKHFTHLFKNQIGFTPKIFQRIIKFNQILPKIQNQESISWTQISYECGYYDQSHFIRDFKKFSGFNPSEFIEMDFDRNNFFPMER